MNLQEVSLCEIWGKDQISRLLSFRWNTSHWTIDLPEQSDCLACKPLIGGMITFSWQTLYQAQILLIYQRRKTQTFHMSSSWILLRCVFWVSVASHCRNGFVWRPLLVRIEAVTTQVQILYRSRVDLFSCQADCCQCWKYNSLCRVLQFWVLPKVLVSSF